MPALVDVRPPGLNCLFRRGTSLTTTITWPAGALAGRTFTATLDGVGLGLIVLGDVMVITATVAQTAAAAAGPLLFVLTDTTGDDQPIITGRWTPSDRPSAVSQQTVQLTMGAVEVTIAGGQLLDPDMFPEIAAADPAELGIVTAAGVTELTLLDTMARHAYKHVTSQYYWSVYGTSAAATLVQDTLVLMPVWLSAGTLDRIGVDVSTAQASGVIRLGVYSETAGLPSARIAEAASTADASTPGIKDLTISAAIPTNGRYWLACVAQGAAGIQIQGGPSTGPASGLPLPLGTSAQGGTTNFLSRIQGSQSGALPATTTPTGTPNSSRARWHFRYA